MDIDDGNEDEEVEKPQEDVERVDSPAHNEDIDDLEPGVALGQDFDDEEEF